MTVEISLLPYQPPKGYYYVTEEFKRNVVRIWLCTDRKFDFNMGKPTRTIHSFFNTKTKCFHSPINSTTVGDQVNIKDTRPWTTMPIKSNPLMSAFV